jgi:hypothetical protein
VHCQIKFRYLANKEDKQHGKPQKKCKPKINDNYNLPIAPSMITQHGHSACHNVFQDHGRLKLRIDEIRAFSMLTAEKK